jgi:hypothetical protein
MSPGDSASSFFVAGGLIQNNCHGVTCSVNQSEGDMDGYDITLGLSC